MNFKSLGTLDISMPYCQVFQNNKIKQYNYISLSKLKNLQI